MAAWRALMQEAWERSVVFTQFLCFLHVFSNHVCQVHQCLGPSMLPTFNMAGDILLLEHLSVKFEKVRSGDVVMARSPVNPRVMVCKRVLGLEGDRVTVLPTNSKGHIRHVVVPKGHVWLQGDNIYNSTDSRHYGPVPYALIQGKVCYRKKVNLGLDTGHDQDCVSHRYKAIRGKAQIDIRSKGRHSEIWPLEGWGPVVNREP